MKQVGQTIWDNSLVSALLAQGDILLLSNLSQTGKMSVETFATSCQIVLRQLQILVTFTSVLSSDFSKLILNYCKSW